MAAQAIGEPGTQLTLKTFHMGGVTAEDITSGLPRVEELVEVRIPKRPAVLAELAGTVDISESKDQRTIRVVSSERAQATFELTNAYASAVADGDSVTTKQPLATAPGKKAIRSTLSGKVTLKGKKLTVTSTEPTIFETTVPNFVNLTVKSGESVGLGQQLTEGHWDLALALRLRGKADIRRYILQGIQEIYSSQGQTIHDKHIEIIIRQLFSKVRVLDEGDSHYLVGQIVERTRVVQENQQLHAAKKKPIMIEDILLGLTRVSLKTESFLSAASFQETTTVLLDAAVRGAVDGLRGLKENVIIGKLIPAGTGFRIPADLSDKHDLTPV